MFHLFKRVYLDHDVNVNLFTTRVVLSENVGMALSTEHDFVGGEHLIFNHQDPTTLTPHEICGLLQLLHKRDDKVIVYCDTRIYAKLTAVWLKSMFPKGNCTSTMYSLLIQCLDVRELAEWGFKRKKVLLSPTIELRRVWAEAAVCEHMNEFITGPAVNDISVEFHILRYLMGYKEHAASARSGVELIIRRAVRDYALERRETQIMSVFSTNDLSVLNETLLDGGKSLLRSLEDLDEVGEILHDEAMELLRLDISGGRDGVLLGRLMDMVYLGAGDFDEMLDIFVHMCSQQEALLNIFSSGDIGQFSFPFINAVYKHRDYLLNSITV